MVPKTESDFEDEVTEEVGRDVILDSVNTKGTASKASAVCFTYTYCIVFTFVKLVEPRNQGYIHITKGEYLMCTTHSVLVS